MANESVNLSMFCGCCSFSPLIVIVVSLRNRSGRTDGLLSSDSAVDDGRLNLCNWQGLGGQRRLLNCRRAIVGPAELVVHADEMIGARKQDAQLLRRREGRRVVELFALLETSRELLRADLNSIRQPRDAGTQALVELV